MGKTGEGDERILRAAASDTDLRHRLCRHRQQYRVHPLAYPLIRALAEDVAPILVATRINYRRPVTISDPLVGRMRVAGLGRVRWRLAAEFAVGSVVHAEAEQEGLFMRLSTRRPIAIPEPIRRWHGG
jgi:acyl-CoA thioesterase FadM